MSQSDNLSNRPVIYSVHTDLPYPDLVWKRPIHVLGEPGNFVIAMRVKQRDTPIYMETPECSICVKRTTAGEGNPLVKVGKNYFMDFLGTDVKWLSFLEHLEEQCHKQLLQSQTEWFQTEMTEEDMENLFIPPFKMVKGKGGKQFSVRTSFPLEKQVKLFDEDKHLVDYDLENIGSLLTEDTRLKAIVEIVGIKCSPRNFHLEMEVKQMMMIQENPVFEDCLITAPTKTHILEKTPSAELANPIQPTTEIVEKKITEPTPEPKIEDLLQIQEFCLEEAEPFSAPTLTETEQAIEKMKKIRVLAMTDFLKNRGIQGEELLWKKITSV